MYRASCIVHRASCIRNDMVWRTGECAPPGYAPPLHSFTPEGTAGVSGERSAMGCNPNGVEVSAAVGVHEYKKR